MTSAAAAKVSPIRKLRIEYRALASLIPHPRNANTHPPEQVAQIAASIREFGWTNPILVDDDERPGLIIAGHGRRLAAPLVPIDPVPCINLSGLTSTQKRAYMLADNEISRGAKWDDFLLREELDILKGDGFDIASIGFDLDQVIARMTTQIPPADRNSSGAANGGSRRALPPMGDMEYRIVIECSGEKDQAEKLARFEREGLTCRALIS